MLFVAGETVQRLRAARSTDPYSGQSTEYDWAAADALDIPGCGIADGGSTEPVEQGRSQIQADFDVIMDADADVRSDDRLVVRGLTCTVQGRPFGWRHPGTGWVAGMVVRARIVQG